MNKKPSFSNLRIPLVSHAILPAFPPACVVISTFIITITPLVTLHLLPPPGETSPFLSVARLHLSVCGDGDWARYDTFGTMLLPFCHYFPLANALFLPTQF